MSSIMDKLGNARRWAAHAMANDGPIDARDEALVDVIRAVEMLAMERENKPAAASVGYGALPTAQEIVDVWSKVSGIIVEHRAMLAVEMVRARVIPELASRDKRIAELEANLAEASRVIREEASQFMGYLESERQLRRRIDELEGLLRVAVENQERKLRAELLVMSQRDELLQRIAELEKRLAEETAPTTVDGKTPGQVFGKAFRDGFGKRVVKDPDKELVRINGELRRDYKREQELDWANAMEIGAQAVLRAFGPAIAKQAAVDAFGRLRERIKGMPGWWQSFDRVQKVCIRVEEAIVIIDDELARLETPKPTSDHVHELGPCSFCDKRPTGQEFVLACKARLPKAGVNITVESPIHWGVIDDVVGELFEQWRAEASPK